MYGKMLIVQFSYNFWNKNPCKIEIAPKLFFVFFQPQIEFCTQTNIFQKKICMQTFNFLFA